MKFFLPLLFISISAWANYCIQVVTLYNFKLSNAPENVMHILATYPDARIERRSSYEVLRVGDFASYSEAKTDLGTIRTGFSDAYIRKCDYDRSQVVYAPSQKSHDLQASQPAPIIENRPPRYVQPAAGPQPATTARRYEQPKPAAQPYSDTLWQDCQKCFAPVYLEEEEEETAKKPHTTKTVQPSTPAYLPQEVIKEPGLAPVKPAPIKDDRAVAAGDDNFWVDAIGPDESGHVPATENPYDRTLYPPVERNLP